MFQQREQRRRQCPHADYRNEIARQRLAFSCMGAEVDEVIPQEEERGAYRHAASRDLPGGQRCVNLQPFERRRDEQVVHPGSGHEPEEAHAQRLARLDVVFGSDLLHPRHPLRRIRGRARGYAHILSSALIRLTWRSRHVRGRLLRVRTSRVSWQAVLMSTATDTLIHETITRCRAAGLRRTWALEELLRQLIQSHRPLTLADIADSKE